MSEYTQTNRKHVMNGVTKHLSEELVKQANDFVDASLGPSVAAMMSNSRKQTEEALNLIKDGYTPAVALVVGSAPIFSAQASLAPEAAINCVVRGVGPVAIQHVIAQWLFEHPEVMAQIVSDPRWAHAV